MPVAVCLRLSPVGGSRWPKLPEIVCIVATDLHQPMLDQAAATGTRRPVGWRLANIMQLPFPDGKFDAVAYCQRDTVTKRVWGA